MHFHKSGAAPKNESFVVIEEVPSNSLEHGHNEQDADAKSTPGARVTTAMRRFAYRLFPMIGEPPLEHLDDLHKRAAFPWLGLLCLIGAFMTIWLSFIMFKHIDKQPEIENKYLKPSSWLSAMASANSIALHIALSEGVTVAWWYKASRAEVTLRELHDTWVMGTSTMGVLFSGKRFNYVAMGTLFVATIPLNGFLLQNSVAYVADTKTNSTSTTLHVPVSGRLPLGYSAAMTNGTLGEPSDGLNSIASSFNGLSAVPAGFFYTVYNNDFSDIGCINKDWSAVCKAKVNITGFDMKCNTSMTEQYDLRPDQHVGDQPYTATVFNSSVRWTPQDPNSIYLDVIYKPNNTCQGIFETRHCKFEASEMAVPVQIQSDKAFLGGTVYGGDDSIYLLSPLVAIDVDSERSNFTVIKKLPVYAAEGQGNSTFGGIAQWLASRFNGSIEWTLRNGSWSTKKSGVVASSYSLNTYIYSQFPNGSLDGMSMSPFKPIANNASWCKHTYFESDWLADIGGYDPTESIFLALNSFMLGASAEEMQTRWNNLFYNDTLMNMVNNLTLEEYDAFFPNQFINMSQNFAKADQMQDALKYNIRYKYWGASVAVTMAIILMIVPLFWGFWTLDRRATLSPFETAAAFDARPLEGVDMKKGTTVLLKEIGRKPLHGSMGSGINSRNASEVRLNAA